MCDVCQIQLAQYSSAPELPRWQFMLRSPCTIYFLYSRLGPLHWQWPSQVLGSQHFRHCLVDRDIDLLCQGKTITAHSFVLATHCTLHYTWRQKPCSPPYRQSLPRVPRARLYNGIARLTVRSLSLSLRIILEEVKFECPQ